MLAVVYLSYVFERPRTLHTLEALSASVLVLSEASVRDIPYELEVPIVHQLHDVILVAVQEGKTPTRVGVLRI